MNRIRKASWILAVIFVAAAGLAAQTPAPAAAPAPTEAPAAPALVTATACVTTTGAQITLHLSAAADVQVRILNLAGREIAVLPEQALDAGTRTLLWNGQSAAGTAAPAGQYLISIEARQEGGGLSRVIVPLSK